MNLPFQITRFIAYTPVSYSAATSLVDGLVAPDRFQGYFGFELG